MKIELYNTSDIAKSSEQIILEDIRQMTNYLHRLQERMLIDMESVDIKVITKIESMITVKEYVVTKLIELHNKKVLEV